MEIKTSFDRKHRAVRLHIYWALRCVILSFCWSRPFGIKDDNGITRKVGWWSKCNHEKHSSGCKMKVTFWNGVFFVFNILISDCIFYD